MTRLVFHIGDPKTGSSSIQRALFDGHYTAEGGRIAYPDALNAIPLARSLLPDAPRRTARAQMAAVAAWHATLDAPAAVVSAEHFSAVDPVRLAAALDRARPGLAAHAGVVAYVRPHPGRLVSSWVQRVKTGAYAQGFAPFLDSAVRRGRFRYALRFGLWRAAFGPRFVLRPMVPAHLVQGDVVADFIATVLGGGAVRLTGPARRNESPGMAHLAAIATVQDALRAADVPTGLRHALGAALQGRLAGAEGGGPRPALPGPLAAQLAAAYADDAAETDAAFFPDTRPLTAALALSAVTGAPDEDGALDLDPARWFAPSAVAALKAAAAALAALPPEALDRWRVGFRTARRNRSGDDRDSDADMDMGIDTGTATDTGTAASGGDASVDAALDRVVATLHDSPLQEGRAS